MMRIEPDNVRPTLEQVKSAWGDLIARRSGFFLEDKGLAVALHARFADSADADFVLPRAQAEARHVIAPGRFRLLGGERFIEVAPALANKGQTVDWLIDHVAFADALPVYLGDDDKDEEAFVVIRQRGGIPIVVGQRRQSTQAIERLSSPQAVCEWLQRVLPV
jgi:alpha,alpha-trehalase